MVKLISQTCFGHLGLHVLGPANGLIVSWAPSHAACGEQSHVLAYQKAHTDDSLRS